MLDYNRLNNFLYTERMNVDIWCKLSFYDEIFEVDKNYEDVWNYTFIDLCKIYFEYLKSDFLKRMESTPQPKRFIDIEVHQIHIENKFIHAYHFCNNTKLFADNHSLYTFIKEELLGTQPSRNNLLSSGYEINLYSFIRIARYCLQNGAYAYYEAFLEDMAKKHGVVVDKIIGLTYRETLDEERFGSIDNSLDIDDLIKKPILEVNEMKPVDFGNIINKSYDIELIRYYCNIDSEDEENELKKIIDSIYDIIKNKQKENIKEHKLQIRYTIHLLINNGWVKNELKPKGKFIETFNNFFGFNSNNNDLEAFDFPTSNNKNLVNDSNNIKFSLVYEKLKDAVRINNTK